MKVFSIIKKNDYEIANPPSEEREKLKLRLIGLTYDLTDDQLVHIINLIEKYIK